jgi:hypothetical protein
MDTYEDAVLLNDLGGEGRALEALDLVRVSGRNFLGPGEILARDEIGDDRTHPFGGDPPAL